jgi:hypothetical protein
MSPANFLLRLFLAAIIVLVSLASVGRAADDQPDLGKHLNSSTSVLNQPKWPRPKSTSARVKEDH